MGRKRRTAPSAESGKETPREPEGRRRILLTVAILAVLLALIVAVVATSPLVRPPSGEEPLTIGFTDLEGRHLTTADLRGQVVLIDLMAANCPPCNLEMREDLPAFRNATRGQVVMISLDIWVEAGIAGETVDDLRAFRAQYDADWTFGVPDDTRSLVVEYSVQFPPFKILLDRDGKVVWTKAGTTTSGELLAAVDEVL